MRVGFYLLQSDSVERALPQIAAKAMKAGQRMLVVAGDDALLERLDTALWAERPADFLAHGRSGSAHDARQPILLAETCEATNGAKLCALADGRWREEAQQFDRVLVFFDDSQRASAREVWRSFDSREDVEREFHEQQDGKWKRVA